jgi:3-deoxy-7-phosphoheptulonate synthase
MHDFKDRVLDPERLQTAYLNSATGLNALRSFAKSGDLDLARINEWIVPVENSRRYTDFLTRIRRTVRFLENAGGNFDAREPEFFVSHEALLLHYEEALTRRESRSGLWYNCAAHTVWLGERTRESEAHIEYLRGLDNPIGIKVGASANAETISEILDQLNPQNEKDKIMLISRMGADKIEEALPKLLRKLQEKQHHFILLCDPCHANTRSVNGIKTRYMETILAEIQKFFEVCRSVGVIPGGIHLEISGSPLTECIDDDGVSSGDLTKNYQTRVDPRLNNLQMIDTAFFIGGL